ncbi:MAG: tetratricopeptide repeat protein [Methanomassiliicoccaceae archaeon]|jgi:tetratricopeptide (TPR) repeat protein|nr:tetratricopeptide repeat protein [Methanomassiliicoccaceae archaeon]
MKDVLLEKFAALLSGYASAKIEGSYLSVFGRKIKRSQKGETMDGEVASALSGLRMTENVGKVLGSEKNRRLICGCIFIRDTEPTRRVDPSEMEYLNDTDIKEKVLREIKELMLTVHDRIWAQPGTEEKMGRCEVQGSIRTDLMDVMRELIAVHDKGGSQRPAGGPVMTSYPRPSDTFMGRETELLQLSLLAERSDAVFVCGPAGIGKTEMCRKFAEGWADTEDDDSNIGKRPVIWLAYDGDLRSTIAWHLKVEGIEEGTILNEETLFRYKLSVLADNPRTLMVIDDLNAQDDTHLSAVLQYRFKKIFISRDPGYLKRNVGMEIGTLSEGTAAEMLLRILSDSKRRWARQREREVHSLLSHACYHTLTVAQIARHINMHGTKPRILRRMSAAGTASRPAGDDEMIAARLSMLMAMSSLDGREREILKVLSMLPASGMPLGRFIEFSGLDSRRDGDVLRSLEDKGWAELTHIDRTDDDMISVNPMIADILRRDFSPGEDECAAFFRSVERFFDLGRAFNNWAEKMDVLPVLISAADAAAEGIYAPTLNSLAGRYLRGSGNYDASLRYYFKALDLRIGMFGAEHPGIAPMYTGIGNVYSDKGDYDKAVEYYIKALRVSGRMSGINDPSIASTYNNVGTAYAEREEYGKAIEYYGKALEIRERVLSIGHEDTAATYNSMGNAYSDSGEYGKAIEYYGKALKIREKVFGSDHYYTAATHSNIGVAHLRTGAHIKALESAVKAMEIMNRTAGADHPDTMAAYEMVSYIQKILGNGDEVYSEYRSPTPAEDWNFMYR